VRVLDTFWQLLLGNAGYQLVGVAICFPLELRLARDKTPMAERMRGLTLLLAGAVAMALVGVALEWSKLPRELDTEARLSRLTAWVLAAERAARPFALALPASAFAAASDSEHRRRVLTALALYPESAG